jgi:hypothetical protein
MGKKTNLEAAHQIIKNPNVHEQVQFLVDKKIITTDPPICTNAKCKEQSRSMKWSNRAQSVDKVAWRCTACTTWKSIRHNTFLQFYNVSIAVLLTVILCWSIDL